jgi:hypothetical protein
MGCCGLSTCGSWVNDSEAELGIFLNDNKIKENLKETLVMMDIDCKLIVVENNQVFISIEQPDNLRDEQIKLLYLSIFDAASRLAPLSEEIILIIMIDNDPFIQVSMKTESIRLYRNGSISEQELSHYITIQ